MVLTTYTYSGSPEPMAPVIFVDSFALSRTLGDLAGWLGWAGWAGLVGVVDSMKYLYSLRIRHDLKENGGK